MATWRAAGRIIDASLVQAPVQRNKPEEAEAVKVGTMPIAWKRSGATSAGPGQDHQLVLNVARPVRRELPPNPAINPHAAALMPRLVGKEAVVPNITIAADEAM